MAVILNASTSLGLVQTADTSGELNLQSNGTTRLSVLSTGVSGTLVQGTAVASTSGTSIDFTSLPSWVKRVTVMISQVSSNGSSPFIVQLGTSGGFTASGYYGSTNLVGVAVASWSSGMAINGAGDAAQQFTGMMTISNVTSNSWVAMTCSSRATGNAQFGGGGVGLSGALTQLRFTTVNGTDTFDAGSINIQYEG
jgi:hypothetical protein